MRIYTEAQKFILERKGTCQLDRTSKYLTQNSKIIDSTSLDEQLVFIYLYTDILQYYDPENKTIEENIWRKFMENDDSMILSLIINTNFEKIREELDRPFTSMDRKHIINHNDKEFEFFFKILKQFLIIVNYWYKNLSEENSIKLKLKNLIIQELGPNLADLHDTIELINKNSNNTIFADFYSYANNTKTQNPIWDVDKNSTVPQNINTEDLPSYIYRLVKYILNVIITKISDIQFESKLSLEKSLNTPNHTPNMALLISVLKLMEYAKKTLNSIPQRSLEMYYMDILKFRRRKSVPDTVYVNFVADKNTSQTIIPAGTKLFAGKDDTKEITFLTLEPLTIDSSRIATLHIVEIAQKRQYDQASFTEKKWVISKSYKAKDLGASIPLIPNPDLQTTHKLGILIASPTIYLPAGNRVITITMTLSPESFDSFKQRITRRITDSVQEELSNEIHHLFIIDLSSADNWYRLPKTHYSLSINKILSNSVDLIITLPIDTPPIVPFLKQQTDVPANISSPIIRIFLNEEMGIEYFDIIANLEILKFTIAATVKNYRNFSAYNDLGLLDINKNFYPWGTMPQMGNNFYIKNQTAAPFNLKSLNLNIEWANLPDSEGGFREHYLGYSAPITNNSFLADISFLVNNVWIPSESAQQVVSLFESEKPQMNGLGQASTKTRDFSIDINFLNLSNATKNYSLLDSTSKNGLFRFELSGPKMAFGHSEYADILKKVTLSNLDKNKKNITPAPNKPYTPEIKSIWLDYSLKSEIVFNNNEFNETALESMPERVFNITLFGFTEIFPSREAKPFIVLNEKERIANNSSVYLGIENLKNSCISVHIQIDENSVSNEINLYPPKWQYLANNEWHDFTEKDILHDGTNNFIQSGIIKLCIPKILEPANIKMYEETLFWIRVVNTDKNAAKLPNVLGVYINASKAMRCLEEENMEDQKQSSQLPPQSITKILNPEYSTININQPFESFDGKDVEDDKKFYARVSERLRHKNRPASIWDYEKIVLDKFPEIYMAKCINHTSKSYVNTTIPGTITIVVTPKYSKITHLPTASNHLLKSIKDYLGSISSPFVNIEVVNPAYDEIRVLTDIKIRSKYEKGGCMENLQIDLKNSLSPWSLTEDNEIKLASTIYPSDIFGFIMNKEYVESINKFALLKYTTTNGKTSIVKVNSYDSFITATYPWSTIISAPDHIISINNDGTLDEYVNTHHEGISGMIINEDFLVGPWKYGKRIRMNKNIKDPDLQESIESYCLATKISAF